jgi:hypothetical protein
MFQFWQQFLRWKGCRKTIYFENLWCTYTQHRKKQVLICTNEWFYLILIFNSAYRGFYQQKKTKLNALPLSFCCRKASKKEKRWLRMKNGYLKNSNSRINEALAIYMVCCSSVIQNKECVEDKQLNWEYNQIFWRTIKEDWFNYKLDKQRNLFHQGVIIDETKILRLPKLTYLFQLFLLSFKFFKCP